MPVELHKQGDGRRLLALRNLLGLRVIDLADALGVGAPFISKVENGQKALPDELMVRAAAAYDLPISFFTIRIASGDAAIQTFKKSARATIRDERRVAQQHWEASRLFRRVSERSGYRPVDFPSPDDLDVNDIERIASDTRAQLGVSVNEPILNVVRCLERAGIGVIDNLDELVRARGDHAGISMPGRDNRRPLVALVTSLEGAEKRFTLAHELGHLILDADIAAPVMRRRDVVEKRADRFARALLLPAEAMREWISPTLNLHGYLRVKAEFGVGVDMIVKRGEELGLLDAHRAKSLYIQRSSSGWAKREPVEVNSERPLLLQQALVRAYGADPIEPAAVDIGVAERWIRRWAHLPGHEMESARASVIDLTSARQARR